MDDEQRADADRRGDVLQALMLDSLVPATVARTSSLVVPPAAGRIECET